MLSGVQRMHADELDIDEPLVRRLLAHQFPHWAELPLQRVPSSGTDNALFRLGDDLVVRLPRRPKGGASIEHEYEWTPRLGASLPVAVPTPVAKGAPDHGYPATWAVYVWLEGDNPVPRELTAPLALARDLARLVRAFLSIDLAGPKTRRGAPLTGQDAGVRKALGEVGDMIDVDAAAAAWEEALAAPNWSAPPRWLHGDLLPFNLLVREGRLSAVLDFSLVGVGDPACDLLPAWWLPADASDAFRLDLRVDDATWARGRGWALSMALIALPYYKETNPLFAANALLMIANILGEA